MNEISKAKIQVIKKGSYYIHPPNTPLIYASTPACLFSSIRSLVGLSG